MSRNVVMACLLCALAAVGLFLMRDSGGVGEEAPLGPPEGIAEVGVGGGGAGPDPAAASGEAVTLEVEVVPRARRGPRGG
ncbi:MAG: hypothetical protein ACO4CT_16125, partial [Planctomycetota bacterium]